MLQLELSDRPAGVRERALGEELRRSLQMVLPQDRPAFLRELQERFPTWALAEPQVEAGPRFDEKQLDDPAFLVGRLIALAPTLSAEQKRKLGAMLQPHGYLPPPPPVVPPSPPPQPVAPRSVPTPPAKVPAAEPVAAAADGPVEELRAKLGLGRTDPVDVNRAIQVLATLSELAGSLDEVVWAAWRRLAPPSTEIRKQFDLKRVMGRCVTGDASTPPAAPASGATALLKLVAALTDAIPQSGKFAAAHVRKFTPAEIERAVRTEGKGGLLKGFERQCWEKFQEVAGPGLDEKAIDAGVRKATAEFVERWMLG